MVLFPVQLIWRVVTATPYLTNVETWSTSFADFLSQVVLFLGFSLFVRCFTPFNGCLAVQRACQRRGLACSRHLHVAACICLQVLLSRPEIRGCFSFRKIAASELSDLFGGKECL